MTKRKLTAIQQQIVNLVASGYSDKEIAHRINRSLPSVKFCLHCMYERMKVRNRAHLAIIAAEREAHG